MGATMMMFEKELKFTIAYKSNQRSFDIYSRKFTHDYMINVVEYNFDGSSGL